MNFGEAIKSVFSNYANFKGRARRSEYWYFVLFNILVSLVLSGLTLISPKLNILNSIYSLVVFIPGLAVAVRRLHDIGKSGWTYLIVLIPAIVLVILSAFVVVATGGTYGYGKSSDLSIGLIAVFFIALIATLVCAIIFIVWMCRDSEPGTNNWGPNPKEQTTDNTNQY